MRIVEKEQAVFDVESIFLYLDGESRLAANRFLENLEEGLFED